MQCDKFQSFSEKIEPVGHPVDFEKCDLLLVPSKMRFELFSNKN